MAFFPINIGDYVVIEDDCVINATSIGSFVHIGKGSIIVRPAVVASACLQAHWRRLISVSLTFA